MFNYNCKKDINKIFVGLITSKRKKFLKNFPDALIIDSKRGRDNSLKQRDERYFKFMSRSKFALCPDGDFTWTYRFFEAIIFKSIPIIENYSPLYEGYKFYKPHQKLIYRKDWVKHNLNKLKKEMTWNRLT